MDMVSLNIVSGILVSICRDMGVTLMRTSYSTIFSESLDFTCGLALPNGDLIATGDYCPTMIGGLPLIISNCVKEIDISDLHDGDIILHNDPYRGGLHTPEHTFFKPVFVGRELIGFSVAIGHICEVGGMVPAGFAGEATEVFHEGLRVPPVKIKRAGKDVDDVWRLLLANVRTPRYNYGDFRAMIAAVDLGERRMADLVRKHGVDSFCAHMDGLMDYSERRMRAEIAAIPDGRYTFHDYMEDDGIEDKPYRIAVEVTVDGDGLVVDYHGSSPQAKGPINATLGVAWGAAYNAILQLTSADIPKNSGCFRPIKVLAPPGSVVNVDYPGPSVGGNTESHCRIANAVMGALSAPLKERSAATDGATHSNFLFGGVDKQTGEFFCCYDLTPVGWGGRSFADGNDAVGGINGNCPHIQVEVFEFRFPWHVEEFRLVDGSGGPGTFRGGLSLTKTLLCTDTEMTFSYMSDRQKLAPWGIHGGGDGGKAELFMKPAGTEEWRTVTDLFGKASPSKFGNVPIRPGDRIRITSPAGGGWGEPSERDPARVIEDAKDRWITREQACAVYGLDEAVLMAAE
ncbi:hydantoinase B/oxoprolinase family protein [Rhizobium sp. CG5]|uniref:hydantoinase B/oxoprolinase family protein n=1 Tax=Rhizobium sp. CG5 TaxID=2726076 RepID=UPI00203421E9|nr:hydantoinase B/oxoprolinase family protein [Rhizobium sp. CG5]MCM2476389.1 hydantoinase B/oxoprolinase family protein [Rhizobium sp. CG5]